MEITVVVRTKNAIRTIRKCIFHLQEQTVKPKEIIVVDSGSEDGTLEVAKELGCKIVWYNKNEAFNYSRAINIGVEQASSPYIALVSAHVYLIEKRTLEWMCQFLSDESNRVAVSTYMQINDFSPLKAYQDVAQLQVKQVSYDNFDGMAMSNSCSLFRHSDWLDYPFSEEIPRCEDQEWAFHYLKNEKRVALLIQSALGHYDNPRRTIKWEVWNYRTLHDYFSPHFNINAFMLLNYRKFLSSIVRRNRKMAKYHFFLANHLLSEILFPTKNLRPGYTKKGMRQK